MDVEAEVTNLGNTIGQLETRQADHHATRERVLADPKLSPVGKQEQISKSEADYASALTPVRDDLRARIESLTAELNAQESALYRASRPTPTGAAEWSEASARAQFIREDLERMVTNPKALTAALKQAKADGDKIAAWLFIRYADRMDAVTEEQGRLRAEAMRAEADLFPVDEKKLAAVKAAQRRAAELSSRAHGLLTGAETREFAARLGVRAEYIR